MQCCNSSGQDSSSSSAFASIKLVVSYPSVNQPTIEWREKVADLNDLAGDGQPMRGLIAFDRLGCLQTKDPVDWARLKSEPDLEAFHGGAVEGDNLLYLQCRALGGDSFFFPRLFDRHDCLVECLAQPGLHIGKTR